MSIAFKKLHPLLLPVLAYLLGLVFCHLYAPPFIPFLLLGVIMLAGSLLGAGIKGRFFTPLLCVGLFIFAVGWLGCLRAAPLAENHIARLADQRYHLMELEISGASQPNEYGWQAAATVVRFDGSPAQGGIELRGSDKQPPPQVGQVVRANLRPRPIVNFANPGSSDWVWLRAQENVYATATVGSSANMQVIAQSQGFWIERLRQAWNNLLSALAPGNARGLMRAITLGQRAEPEPQIKNSFAELGIAHLLAISGLHLGLVWGFFFVGFRLLLACFSKLLLHFNVARLAASLAFMPTLFYALLGGASLPTLRALIMAACLVAGLWINRTYKAVGGLSLAALIICLLWPESLFTISFQLSFAAVCAIILVATPMARYFKKYFGFSRKMAWLVGFVAFTGGIELFIWPLMVQSFHQVPWLSLLANSIFIPLVGFVLLPFTLLAGFLGLLWPEIGAALMQGAWFVAEASVYLVNVLASAPFAVSYIAGPSVGGIVLIYLAWLIFFLLAGRKRIYLAGAILLLALACWATPQPNNWQAGRLQAWVLDVGQGQGVVVKLPNEQIMVVDCGAAGSMDPGQRIMAPFLWQQGISQVDIVVASHPHPDHFSGLTFLVRYFNPRELWVNGYEESEDYAALLRLAKERKVRVRVLRAPYEQEIGGAQVKVIWPIQDAPYKDSNDLSLWLGIGQDNNWLWLPGDNGPRVEKRMHAFPDGNHILLAAHHGGKGSCTKELMQALKPQTVIFSTGCTNNYGMPRAEGLSQASAIGAQILITGNHGCISMFSEPNGWRSETYLARPRPCVWGNGG